jgi:hypothetical protein
MQKILLPFPPFPLQLRFTEQRPVELFILHGLSLLIVPVAEAAIHGNAKSWDTNRISSTQALFRANLIDFSVAY